MNKVSFLLMIFIILLFGCNKNTQVTTTKSTITLIEPSASINTGENAPILQHIINKGWEGFWQLNDGNVVYDGHNIKITKSLDGYSLEVGTSKGIEMGTAVEVRKGVLNGVLDKSGKIEIYRDTPYFYEENDDSALMIVFLEWQEQIPIGPYSIIKN